MYYDVLEPKVKHDNFEPIKTSATSASQFLYASEHSSMSPQRNCTFMPLKTPKRKYINLPPGKFFIAALIQL